MRNAQGDMRRARSLTRVVGLVMAAWLVGTIGLAPAAEDPFDSLAIQRPAQPEPAPDLALPSLAGRRSGLRTSADRSSCWASSPPPDPIDGGRLPPGRRSIGNSKMRG